MKDDDGDIDRSVHFFASQRTILVCWYFLLSHKMPRSAFSGLVAIRFVCCRLRELPLIEWAQYKWQHVLSAGGDLSRCPEDRQRATAYCSDEWWAHDDLGGPLAVWNCFGWVLGEVTLERMRTGVINLALRKHERFARERQFILRNWMQH